MINKITIPLFIFFISFFLSPFQSRAQQAAEQQSYEWLMNSGNEKFNAKDYISAKTYFEMALQAKDNKDEAAQKKLNETVEKIRQQMALQEEFYSHLDYGDRLFNQQKLEEALVAYNEALKIFPEDKYTLARVSSINKTLTDEAEKLSDYNNAMQLGNELLANNNLDEALLQFSNASALYPDQQLPKDKIAETKKQIDALNRRIKQAETLVAEAQNLLTRKDYQGAINKLEEATTIYPEESNYIIKLNEARDLLDLSTQYNKVLADADRFYGEKNFSSARSQYEQALQIWPGQAYPADMIQLINRTLQSEAYLADQAYNEALAEAQNHESAMEFPAAIEAYQKALQIKPQDVVAAEKITELEALLAAQQANEEKELQYQQLLSSATSAEQKNELENAIALFKQALELKPEEQTINGKIESLQLRLAQQSEAQVLENSYAAAIRQADSLYNSENLVEAVPFYQQAAAIFSDRAYPREQITKIENLQKERLLRAEKEAQYAAIISTAETLLSQGQLQEARQKYVEAFNLDPSKSETQTKINEIDGLIAQQALAAAEKENEFTRLISLAKAAYDNNQLEEALQYYQQAAAIKPNVTDIQAQIGLVNQQINEKQQLEARETNYQQQITLADKFYAENQLTEAKSAYQKAQNIFPDRTYPSEKVAEINQQIEIAAAEQAKENAFNNFVAAGDAAMTSQDFVAAKTAYQSATELKPTEEYPKQQLQQAQVQLDMLAQQAAADEAYQAAIAKADQFYVAENWTEAELAYQEAATIKPAESYPNSQLAAIKSKLDEIAQAQARQQQIEQLLLQASQSFDNKKLTESKTLYDQVLLIDATNEMALTRSTEIKLLLEKEAKERQEKYEQHIASGDQYLAEKKYQDAITAYKTALGFKFDDEYASTKISQIDNILKERLLQLKTAYNKIISEADQYYQQKTFDKAIESYLEAKALNTGETYPQDMINQITKMIEDNMLVELNRAPIIIDANKTKRFDFAPVNVTERRGNYILIKARNNGTNNFPLIISFGSKNGRNGGFVLPIPEDQEYHDFVVRIGSQYKWFSEDNTWIEIYPENGSVELGLTQISKGY